MTNILFISFIICTESFANLFAGFLISWAIFKLPSNIENNIHCPTATASLKASKRGGGIADAKELKHNPLHKTCFNLKGSV
jgi:hypothetical protein